MERVLYPHRSLGSGSGTPQESLDHVLRAVGEEGVLVSRQCDQDTGRRPHNSVGGGEGGPASRCISGDEKGG